MIIISESNTYQTCDPQALTETNEAIQQGKGLPTKEIQADTIFLINESGC